MQALLGAAAEPQTLLDEAATRRMTIDEVQRYLNLLEVSYQLVRLEPYSVAQMLVHAERPAGRERCSQNNNSFLAYDTLVRQLFVSFTAKF